MKKFVISFVCIMPVCFFCSTTDISNPSFSQDVQPIFSSSCAFSTCHGTSDPATASLDLSQGNAFSSLVNVPSTEIPSIYRVVPADAASSYLFQKITGASGISGVMMPKTGSITQTEKDIITNWINQGALNN